MSNTVTNNHHISQNWGLRCVLGVSVRQPAVESCTSLHLDLPLTALQQGAGSQAGYVCLEEVHEEAVLRPVIEVVTAATLGPSVAGSG